MYIYIRVNSKFLVILKRHLLNSLWNILRNYLYGLPFSQISKKVTNKKTTPVPYVIVFSLCYFRKRIFKCSNKEKLMGYKLNVFRYIFRLYHKIFNLYVTYIICNLPIKYFRNTV